MTPPFRRRNYFIKKRFQTSFFLRFVGLLLLEAALIAGLFLYAARGTITTGYHGSAFAVEQTARFFFVNLVLLTLIIGIAVGLCGMVVFTVLSHRIAGPLYRFEKSLEEIAEGNLAHRCRLRKNDQLDELSQSLNRFTERLDDRLGQLKRLAGEASRLCAKAETAQDRVRLTEIVARLKEATDAFKTSS